MTAPNDASELQNASWPVLIVEAKGKIIRANKNALEVFGEKIRKEENSHLASIWEASNGQNLEHFLSTATTPSRTVSVKLASQNGNGAGWLACVCPTGNDGQNLLIQLFPEPQSAAPDDKAASADAAQAHKQKLDCALQLARTVSHEFNNALTSVLGHTSLILGKTEPNHPWRRSFLSPSRRAG